MNADDAQHHDSRIGHRSVRVFAPAKINWILSIIGKRADGYHEIDTIFQALNYGDQLEIGLDRTSRQCRIRCSDPAVPTDSRNLVARAWELMANSFPRQASGVRVKLTKRLPAGGGVGGGSSDAAATLVGLNRLWNLRKTRADLEHLAAAVGSDCAFFIRGGTQRGTGRGEKLSKLTGSFQGVWLVIVVLGFPSDTATAYQSMRNKNYCSHKMTVRFVNQFAQCMQRRDLQNFLFNAFYSIVTMHDFRYKEAHEQIAAAGLGSPMLAGSGSSLFAFARDHAHALRACRDLGRRYPGSFVARPIRTGVRLLPDSG